MNKEEKKWRVTFGIHRGTLTSRDTWGESFDTEQEARDYHNKTIEAYQPGADGFGYVLWFADLYDPDNNQVAHSNGFPYI